MSQFEFLVRDFPEGLKRRLAPNQKIAEAKAPMIAPDKKSGAQNYIGGELPNDTMRCRKVARRSRNVIVSVEMKQRKDAAINRNIDLGYFTLSLSFYNVHVS